MSPSSLPSVTRRQDYAIVVATCDRHDILPICVGHVLEQHRPPSQLIIVDATDSWRTMKAQLEDVMRQKAPGVSFEYVEADQRSTTAQRNQGLRLVNADVVFFLDDDSFMYPACASEVMTVYEQDTEGQVAGCQASLAEAPPGSPASLPAQKVMGGHGGVRMGRVLQWVNRYVLMMAGDQMFIPYWGRQPKRPLPPNIPGISQVALFHGCRMTFRRSSLGTAPFDKDLGSYAAGEDLDASYHISRTGLLVQAHAAQLYHHTAASGRLSRGHAAELSAMNMAFLLRKHAGARPIALLRLYVWLLRRMLAELIKDSFSGRFSLPQFCAMLRATASAWLLWLPRQAELAERYANWQLAISRRHGRVAPRKSEL